MDKAELIRHEIEKRRDHNLAIGNPLFAAMAEEDIELLSFIDSLQEEPVSEDLEKAAIEYCGGHKGADARVRAGFIMGTNWQKQQMIKNAVETIIDSNPNDYGEFIPVLHVKLNSSYKDGEKVRVIIIKKE